MIKPTLTFLLLTFTFLLCTDSYAFRRLPYSQNPNQLCTLCQRVGGFVPTMTIRSNLNPDFLFDNVYAAAHTWNIEGNSMFTFGVTGDNDLPISDDNKNAIIMGDYAGFCQDDVLGLSIPQPPSPLVNSPGTDPEGPKYIGIVERDLVICENQDWFTGLDEDSGWWNYDLQSVILHELGHHLGLGHSNCNGNAPDIDCTFEDDTGAVMDTAVLSWWWGDIRRHLLNQPNGTFLEQGDVQGVQHIYGIYNADIDGDGTENLFDNCQGDANPDQLNTDGDLYGDACDDDKDNDGVPNAADNCEIVKNAGQEDADDDGIGDVCDDDFDNDGIPNAADNCPFIFNSAQGDFDGDGIGDNCDDDDDNDGVPDATDNCPAQANANQIDTDGDGIGNSCDPFNMTAEQIDMMAKIYSLYKDGLLYRMDAFCKAARAALGYLPKNCD